jgi:hypothetical protein
MSKVILATALGAAALGLAACGDYDKEEYNEANATYNAEETYADNTADYNMGDMNDMNAMSDTNAMDNATTDTAGNAATNETNSY